MDEEKGMCMTMERKTRRKGIVRRRSRRGGEEVEHEDDFAQQKASRRFRDGI